MIPEQLDPVVNHDNWITIEKKRKEYANDLISLQWR